MNNVLLDSLPTAIAAGLGIALSYALGFVERTAKHKMGIADPQPRLGFWLSLCRWLGIMLVASISHSRTDPILYDGQLRFLTFFVIGLVGGIVIALIRVALKWRWRVDDHLWFWGLDALYMLAWSFATALMVFAVAQFIENKTINYVLPTFLMMLQFNGMMRAFVQTAEQRKLRASQHAK